MVAIINSQIAELKDLVKFIRTKIFNLGRGNPAAEAFRNEILKECENLTSTLNQVSTFVKNLSKIDYKEEKFKSIYLDILELLSLIKAKLEYLIKFSNYLINNNRMYKDPDFKNFFIFIIKYINSLSKFLENFPKIFVTVSHNYFVDKTFLNKGILIIGIPIHYSFKPWKLILLLKDLGEVFYENNKEYFEDKEIVADLFAVSLAGHSYTLCLIFEEASNKIKTEELRKLDARIRYQVSYLKKRVRNPFVLKEIDNLLENWNVHANVFNVKEEVKEEILNKFEERMPKCIFIDRLGYILERARELNANVIRKDVEIFDSVVAFSFSGKMNDEDFITKFVNSFA